MEPTYDTGTESWNATVFVSAPASKSTTGNIHNITIPSTASEPYSLSYWELIFGAVVLIIILMAGVIGNSMIIWSVILSRKLRTSTNAFVISLSIADLLMCLFLPWYIAAFLGKDMWPLPKAEWLCGITGFMVFTCTGASLYNLAAIALNRLVYITCPLRYKSIYKPWAIAVMVALTWLIPGGTIVVLLLVGIGGFGYETVDYPSCSDLDDISGAGTFNLVQTLVGFPIPFVTIIVCYISIYVYLRRHFKNRMDRQVELKNNMEANSELGGVGHHDKKLAEIAKQELEITKNLFLVVCAFFASFLLFFIGNAIPNAGHFVFYAALPTFANSAVNFGIYASRHPQFKIVLGCMIKCRYADIPEPSNVLKAILSRHQM